MEPELAPHTNDDSVVSALNNALSVLLQGKIPDLTDTPVGIVAKGFETESAPVDAVVADIATKFSTLVGHLSEMRTFMQALCVGYLDAQTPGRRNYLAAPLKELHTQFYSLTWSMEQLAKGNVVSKLYYRGVLFEAFNSIISKVATLSGRDNRGAVKGTGQGSAAGGDQSNSTWDWSVNSWRYHQILSALNNLSIMLVEISLTGEIVYMNKPARERFGDVKRLFCVGELEKMLMSMNASDQFPQFHEILDEASGAWYKVTSDKSNFVNTGHTGYIHMIDNISEWKKQERNLRLTATTDPLTGVYNRRFGLSSLETALKDARTGKKSCAAFIDLDGLKEINDNHGHTSGDYAIKSIADVLVSSVRDDKDIVCRFGGDEFIIIFTNCAPSTARRAVARMYEKLDEINRSGGKPFVLAFSVGIVEINAMHDMTLREVIERMDAAMYANKTAFKQTRLASSGLVEAAVGSFLMDGDADGEDGEAEADSEADGEDGGAVADGDADGEDGAGGGSASGDKFKDFYDDRR